MARIIKKEKLAEKIWRYRLEAPRIAKKRTPGQFIILRPVRNSDRIPVTIANVDPTGHWIEIIFHVEGRTTDLLSMLNEGDNIHDLIGPLGMPAHIENFGHCVCVGGGVGIAPLFPIARGLSEAGNRITSIIGARSRDLLILRDEFESVSNQLHLATDDGTVGTRGFVSTVLQDLIRNGEHFNAAFVIGPVMMMKAVSQGAMKKGIRTWVSLNPVMVDGAGMCRSCRVTVDGNHRFACVDGPEFDASTIDWNEMSKQLTNSRLFEPGSLDKNHCYLEKAE